jgi:hypothetical protein
MRKEIYTEVKKVVNTTGKFLLTQFNKVQAASDQQHCPIRIPAFGRTGIRSKTGAIDDQ